MIQGKLVSFDITYPSSDGYQMIGNLKTVAISAITPITTVTVVIAGKSDLSDYMNSEVVIMTKSELKEYMQWKLNKAIMED